jgi:tRNA1Val (adenine37-N6)-methyltransferase
MSNAWFQFKQFRISQDRTAMKVGTDGVLLGAWAECDQCHNILDVGTGTGLLALMLAQKNPDALVYAIEIDLDAALQAAENVKASVFLDRIRVVHADFRCWEPDSTTKFDLIICNPPFFTKSLKNPDNQRAIARHDEELPIDLLVFRSMDFLNDNGKLAMILPVGRFKEAILIAEEAGLQLHRILNVRGNQDAPVKRVLLEWGMEKRALKTAELFIETGVRGIFSEEYRRLTDMFYL